MTKKENDKKRIFDENGKLKTIKKPATKNTELSEEEKKKIQCQRWRDYYHKNKDKYKVWNKKWRDKQKEKKQQIKSSSTKKETE